MKLSEAIPLYRQKCDQIEEWIDNNLIELSTSPYSRSIYLDNVYIDTDGVNFQYGDFPYDKTFIVPFNIFDTDSLEENLYNNFKDIADNVKLNNEQILYLREQQKLEQMKNKEEEERKLYESLKIKYEKKSN